MPNGPLRIGWSAALERFRDLDTGRFISGATAAPWLKVSGGALRDTLGRYVPWSFAGGEVQREFPTGRGDIAAITREVPVDVTDMPVRVQDVLQATVFATSEGVVLDKLGVTMLKGRSYSDVVSSERISARVSGAARGFTDPTLPSVDYTVDEIGWSLTTFYQEGEYLAADYSYFEGM